MITIQKNIGYVTNLTKSSMTNQEKLEAVIKQAQSRGWMEGWRLYDILNIKDGSTKIYFQNKALDLKEYSLNDILYGTDFCEKFFRGGKSCLFNDEKDDICYFCENEAGIKAHKIAMLSMSESERIAFLEKHLEVKEEKKCKCKETSCPIGCKRDHTHLYYSCGVCLFENHQPVDVNQIEKIEKNDFAFEEYMRNKLNEIIQQVNANTKAISACAKDCKINRE